MDNLPLSFLGAPLARAFRARVVVIPPGGTRGYRAEEWEDALVVVERGELELRGRDGARWSYERGSVLCLAELALASLHNPGQTPVLLSAISRRRRVSV